MVLVDIVTFQSLQSPKYASLSGVITSDAHVHHIATHQSDSASVAISTLPAVVVSALEVVPDANAAQAPPIYC